MTGKIPPLDPTGVLPLVQGLITDARGNAPHVCEMAEFVSRFGGSKKRRRLLLGLLRMVSDLQARGVRSGWLWVDGSFTQEIEREPDDVDVVAFMRGAEFVAVQADATRFYTPHSKRIYGIDSRIVTLDDTNHERVMRLTVFYYELWTKVNERKWGRRGKDGRKGFLHINLPGLDVSPFVSHLTDHE